MLNEKGVDYFVGDIHAHYYELQDELERLNFDPSMGDRLFSTGDNINYGENSVDCILLLMEEWFKSAFGNHEKILLGLLNDSSVVDALLKVGGEWVVDLVDEPSRLKYLLAIIYSKMFLSFTVETSVGRIGVIHAQAPDDWNDAISGNIDEDVVLWSLDNYKRPGGKWIKNIDVVVSGHVNCSEPVCKGNQIWIDTVKLTGNLTVLTAADLVGMVNNV